jgi:hypothetical protein
MFGCWLLGAVSLFPNFGCLRRLLLCIYESCRFGGEGFVFLCPSQPVNVGHGHKEGNCPELAISSILLGTGAGWANAAGQIEDGTKTAICKLKLGE